VRWGGVKAERLIDMSQGTPPLLAYTDTGAGDTRGFAKIFGLIESLP
jgi:hypothetical protein